jgi:phosphoribosylformimino-5-aminoimidazole carboxamide ribotide isomerase
MQLVPALDIRGGRCVRLLQGDFDRETRYDIDPRSLAARYRALGAEWLHVVDLDGAASGRPANSELIREIASTHGLRVQLGGGIRDRESLAVAGRIAERLVIGSRAVSHPGEVAAWAADVGAERIVLGFDVRLATDGVPYVTTHGWTKSTSTSLYAAIDKYAGAGIRHVLCTDVERDGALTGPNLALYRDCVTRWPELEFQASGGVRDSRDLAALAATGVAAAISGKALLEGRLTDEELRRFLPNA